MRAAYVEAPNHWAGMAAGAWAFGSRLVTDILGSLALVAAVLVVLMCVLRAIY